MEQLAALPNIVVYGLSCFVGGVVGTFVMLTLSRNFRIKKIKMFLGIVCFALVATAASVYFAPLLQKNADVENVLNDLKEQRLFSVIFKTHPEAEDEIRSAVSDILKNNSGDNVFLKVREVSANAVEKYFSQYVPLASNEATYKMLKRNVIVMKMFKNKPELCVSYYLGRPYSGNTDLTEEFINTELDMKADIIESAIAKPSKLPENVDVSSVIEALSKAYVAKGYKAEDISKIGQVDTISPDEACKVATKFAEVLASLPEEKAANMFKRLLYVAAEK